MGLFKKKENKEAIEITLFHVEGLPIAEKTACKISVKPTALKIDGAGSEFNLNLSQITVVAAKTDVEIANITSSSAVKGLAGGLMLGPVGAIIGSRATNKEKRTYTPYLIINYVSSNNELSALLFDGSGTGLAINKFVDKIRPLLPNNSNQTFQL